MRSSRQSTFVVHASGEKTVFFLPLSDAPVWQSTSNGPGGRVTIIPNGRGCVSYCDPKLSPLRSRFIVPSRRDPPVSRI